MQLDDLNAGGLSGVGEAAFLTLEISPGISCPYGARSMSGFLLRLKTNA